MPGRVQVKLATNLFIDDQDAMREAAYERLRNAWSGDEDFPYSAASDIPFDEVVHSLVADAVPLELPGCRRSAMEVEVGEQVEDSGAASAADQASEDQDPEDQDPEDRSSDVQDSPDQDSPDQDSADQDSPDQDSPDQDSPDQDSADQDAASDRS
jgi:hypothetical protein